jgi:hypothetical protein
VLVRLDQVTILLKRLQVTTQFFQLLHQQVVVVVAHALTAQEQMVVLVRVVHTKLAVEQVTLHL